MNEEIRENTNGKFITLTFNEEALKKLMTEKKDENEIATLAMRRFLERWRKKYKKSVRHWFVTELGHENTERIHLHGIIWTDESKGIIEDLWQYGIIWIGKWVNEQTINYIIKYIYKQDRDHPNYIAKVLTSPGIGASYINKANAEKNSYNGTKTKETYTFRNGTQASLPIYYRNKLYNEEEREQL